MKQKQKIRQAGKKWRVSVGCETTLSSLRYMQQESLAENREGDTENTCEEIPAESFPNLVKIINSQIKEAQKKKL